MLAMVISLLPMLAPITAYATNAPVIKGDKKITPDTIDTTKTGSLTIYKYETKTSAAAGDNGTGESTNVQIPDGYTPLGGVTFSAWKIEPVSLYLLQDPTSKQIFF